MAGRRSATIPDQNTEARNDNALKTTRDLRKEALDGILQIAQFGCLAFGQFADAGAIGMHGPPIENEVLDLAEQNSKIAAKVDLLIEIGPYAGLVGAAIPFLAQLLVNHGIFKAEQFANAGVVTPDVLESQIKTQMMKRAMDALIEQKRMEEELRAMQEQMAESMNGERPDDE